MAEPSLWPLALYFASVVIMVVAILILSSVIGEKSPMRRATGEPFESGVVHIGSAQNPVSIEFFLVAMFFVIFDLETVFIFAWAVLILYPPSEYWLKLFYQCGIAFLSVSVATLIFFYFITQKDLEKFYPLHLSELT